MVEIDPLYKSHPCTPPLTLEPLSPTLPERILAETRKGNFNYWRNYYDNLSITDLIFLNTGIHPHYPDQAHFNLEPIAEIFTHWLKPNFFPVRVIELGCHRGNLALGLLEKFDSKVIEEWDGYDINYYAIDETVVEDKRYCAHKLTNWLHKSSINLPSYWRVFISSNTLEHFNLDQFRETIQWANDNRISYIILDQPFALSWDNRNNTHILTGTEKEIAMVVTQHGYGLIHLLHYERSSVLAFRRKPQ